MSGDQKLHIIIKGHDVRVDAEGFQGEACEDVVKELDSMLEMRAREAKPERWEQDQQEIQIH